MKKLRIAEMNIFIYCIIYFDGIMEKKLLVSLLFQIVFSLVNHGV